MKLTTQQLKQIIKEELEAVMNEVDLSRAYDYFITYLHKNPSSPYKDMNKVPEYGAQNNPDNPGAMAMINRFHADTKGVFKKTDLERLISSKSYIEDDGLGYIEIYDAF